MSKELVISANRHETRVALLEDDQLVEVYFQRANEYSLAGSIHKGRVTRVLPGMQSAFVDLGLERDTFLYVSDFLDEHEDIDHVTGDEGRPKEASGREGGGREGGGRDGGRREGGRDRGRDRGDRGGDRGRDRDRDRGDRPPQPVAAAAPLETEAVVASEGEAPVVEAVASGEARSAGQPSSGQQSSSQSEAERRGRRRRRRGRGGRGIPESKYAVPGADVTAAGEEGEDVEEDGPETEVEIETAVVEEVSARVLLPGESLAKYRNAPAKAIAVEPEVEVVEEYDEPARFPLDNVIPDAPLHPVPAEGTTKAEVEDEIQLVHPSHTGTPTDSEIEEAEEAAASGPVGLSHLDEDEDEDIQAMILDSIGESESDTETGLVEDTAEDAADAADAAQEAAEGEAGAEGAEPTSGSAEVRERGGRLPHRVSRRGRRRRGGDRRNEPKVATAEGAPAAEGEAEAPVTTAPAQEREPRETRESREPRDREPREQRDRPRQMTAQTRAIPSIADLLKQGQEIIVQIAKEPLGQKGARITSHVALPGRFVVFMPTLEHMGVSRRIGSDEERLRLKRVLQTRRPGTVGGFITRTAAEGRTDDEIAADMDFLYNLWQDIKAKADKKPAPALLHHDLDIVQRILRDQLADDFKAIWIDNEEAFESILRFVERFQPSLVTKVKMYTREAPIFDSFGITQEMEKALRPKVWLKSGGYIVINQTEALVAIDVNTGKFVGKSNRLEDTIVKTNTEAIKEIVRQVRLRDLGGIIVIDFIDMDERKNRQKVMTALEDAMRADRAPYKILQFNDFGLVAITRKRVKQSLERTLCSPCPHCEGAGYVKSVQTVVSEILTEARKMSRSVEGKDVMLRVHPDVAKVIKSHQNKYLEELEETLRRPVLVKSDPLLHHEKFDLA
ncbi:MAG: Rne/Rng family ribonuclease [Acidobacteriota bacterium]